MFDIAPAELLVLGAVAILVIPPKDLPKAMRVAGHWIGRLRNVAGQVRSGFDSMVREGELQDMEKKWAEENARIMREHPAPPPAPMPQMLPLAAPVGPETTIVEGDGPAELVAPPLLIADPVATMPTADDPVPKPRRRSKAPVKQADS